MLTVELFTDEDFSREGAVHIYGPRILDLQGRFPFNLGNGRQLLERYEGAGKSEQRPQPSMLVRVLSS